MPGHTLRYASWRAAYPSLAKVRTTRVRNATSQVVVMPSSPIVKGACPNSSTPVCGRHPQCPRRRRQVPVSWLLGTGIPVDADAAAAGQRNETRHIGTKPSVSVDERLAEHVTADRPQPLVGP